MKILLNVESRATFVEISQCLLFMKQCVIGLIWVLQKWN